MDKDETLKINYDEFREYLLLHPSSNIWDIVHYWRHASVSVYMRVFWRAASLKNNWQMTYENSKELLGYR